MTTGDAAYLVQLVLPVHDNAGKAFPDAIWENLKDRLAEKFGGVTAYRHAPAQGVWAPSGKKRNAEDVFMVEVMSTVLEKDWWAALQADLERTLAQEHVVMRAIALTAINHKQQPCFLRYAHTR